MTDTVYVDKKTYYSEIKEGTMKIEEKYMIPLLDKEWYNIITSIRHMDSASAMVMLEQMYDKIPILFGFPKKKLVLNEFDDKVMRINPDWIDAKDWIDYHAGWIIDYEKSDFNAFHHPVRRLKDKFVLNGDLWK